MVGEQPGWAALTGQTFDEYQGFGWAQAVHPDDMEASVATWNAAVDAKSMYVHEHRFAAVMAFGVSSLFALCHHLFNGPHR